MTKPFGGNACSLRACCVVLVLCAVLPGFRFHTVDELRREQTEAELKALREKYGAKQLIRDMDHIKEDVAKIAELHVDGKLTNQEAIFYFFRMHDFDDNNQLDGLELLKATAHSAHAHPEAQKLSPSDHINAVDSLMELDKDMDGFLSYVELRAIEQKMH